ncbi:AcrR family transcriptional regulator [Actinomadura namibiensis]|uniref:AcrR family transcriptional regulator n=1 Tax=Actinomadura namibiensis TaxID=182080 RepID=A0A7W3LSN4_ACTNM|nr:AcrR family transcriptional regulator [Actinomadura namibiensis]
MDEAILTATRALLAETGYAGLTVDGVAARAGIGKAAIYRRHASKQEMILAAIAREGAPPVPDTGSLPGDLAALAGSAVARLGAPAVAETLIGLLADIDGDPALLERFAALVTGPEGAGETALLERAVRRGELPRPPDPDLFHAVFAGTALSWVVMARLAPGGLPGRLARFTHRALLAGAWTRRGSARAPSPASGVPLGPLVGLDAGQRVAVPGAALGLVALGGALGARHRPVVRQVLAAGLGAGAGVGAVVALGPLVAHRCLLDHCRETSPTPVVPGDTCPRRVAAGGTGRPGTAASRSPRCPRRPRRPPRSPPRPG